ncbi:hypothetical protein BU17DRAFT_75070 [Hysterangium stoloniferum]|nr:hypothetical protein BU17DRAFT_75070 [Hysterangium stoloniferum]
MPGSGKTYRIAVIAGDGIGLEVMPEGLRCLEAAAEKYGFKWNFEHSDFASCVYYEKHGEMLPKNWVEILKPFDAIYFGAVGDPRRYPDHIRLWRSLLQFRRQFDQYVNLRPVRLISCVKSPLALRDPGNDKIDYWVVRENTEGEYSEVGGRMFSGTDRELVTQQTIMTRTGVDRILDYAFKLAQSRPRKMLTSARISITMPYWDERVAEKSKQFPDVKVEKYIDILCAHFVARPHTFDVVVGSNLFGDILSDLGPATTGTIGIAPSGNINPTGEWPSLFEPLIWSGQMMLLHLGETKAAESIMNAIDLVLGRANTSEITPDLGGKAKTQALGAAIEKAIREGN